MERPNQANATFPLQNTDAEQAASYPLYDRRDDEDDGLLSLLLQAGEGLSNILAPGQTSLSGVTHPTSPGEEKEPASTANDMLALVVTIQKRFGQDQEMQRLAA